MDNCTTLEDVLRDRAQRGMDGILFDIYCAAYAAGAGLPDPMPHSASMRQLIWLLADRHRMECPPVLHDELPGWLLSLSRQVDTIDPPPLEGWPV
jgi:hypothetical protein